MSAGEWSVFSADARLGVETLHARFTTHAYEPHAHEEYVFGLIEDGLQTFRYRRAAHWGTPGTFFALDPGEMHDGRAAAASGFVYRALHVAPTSVAAALEDRAEARARLPSFADPVLREGTLAAAFAGAHRVLASPAASPLARETALLGFLGTLAGRHAETPNRAAARSGIDRRVLARVREFLAADLTREPSAAELAALAGTGRFRLLRAFRAAYGMPPHAFLRHLRLAAARRLLVEGEAPAAVAAATGFVDQAHLTRRFKGAYGVTPGRFRAAFRDAD